MTINLYKNTSEIALELVIYLVKYLNISYRNNGRYAFYFCKGKLWNLTLPKTKYSILKNINYYNNGLWYFPRK